MTFSFPTVAHKNEQQDIIVYHNMDSNAQDSQVYPVNRNLLIFADSNVLCKRC